MLRWDALCPSFLAACTLSAPIQEHGLRAHLNCDSGDFRARAEKQASAAALLFLKLRFLALVRCSTIEINCFRTESVLAQGQEE